MTRAAWTVILRSTPTCPEREVIRCHLSTLMHRDKLRITDVARAAGLNRSTVTALYKQTATRVDLPAVDRLCTVFQCSVGDLLEYVPDAQERRQ